ncbi:MAG TPA: S41 family peptidase [Terriglobales bacterium]|nr:S41 family peptidase [Terriglobales bacterium]
MISVLATCRTVYQQHSSGNWLMWLPSIFIIFFVLLVSGCSSLIHPPVTHKEVKSSELGKTFTPAQLKADLDFMFETLEAVHPNLYAYTNVSVIKKERENVKLRLNRPMTRIEFYKELAPLVALLKDGHTSVYSPYEEWEQYKKQGGLLFPFAVEITASHTYIQANYSTDTSITTGTELLSINGKSIQEIGTELTSYISGERQAFKNQLLSNGFGYRLWSTYRWEGPFEVSIKTKRELPYFTKVPGITIEDLKIKLNQTKKQKPEYYTYRYLPEFRAGLIDFLSFSDYNRFKEFLEKTFTQMKAEGAENLIIDIRKNGGGNSTLGDLLLTYLTDKPFNQISQMDIKVSKQIKHYYRHFLPWYIRWLPLQWIHPFGRKLWSTPEGGIATWEEKPVKPKTNKLLFTGKTYVLIGSNTFSSASMFASAVKDYQIGTLIGEETGGLATSYGDVYSFDLPDTRISVGVSHKRFVRPNGQDDGHGVLPDYEASENPEDMDKGIDTVLEFTKQLIKSERQ